MNIFLLLFFGHFFWCAISGEVMDGLFCVCFYKLLFTLGININKQILENFVHVFKNSYFQFFHAIFKILYINLKKIEMWLKKLKIRYFHTLWTLNGENRLVNPSEIVLWMWLGVKKRSGRKMWSYEKRRTKKLADIPFIFFISLRWSLRLVEDSV